MNPIGTRLRMALGGAVCGSFFGLFAGGLLGGLYGALTSNVALGLDVALLGAGLGLLGGAAYGGCLSVKDSQVGNTGEPAGHEPSARRHDGPGRPCPSAASGTPNPLPPQPRQHSI